MALIGIVLLVLWRNGTLRRLVTPVAEGYSDIANRGAAPRMTAVDVLPNAGGAPHIAARSSGPNAAGVPTNGFTPAGPVMASAPLYMRIDDPVVAKAPLAEQLTGLVTLIPDSALDRDLTGGGRFVPDWALGSVNDFSMFGVRYVRRGGEKFQPAMVGGGGGTRLH